MRTISLLAAFGLAAGLSAVAVAQADPVLEQARANGLVGEQPDGYLGLVPGAAISPDVRARVDQLNIRRRAAYTQSAAANNATAADMAAAVACQIFAGRIAVGERYRNEAGQWRQRTAADPVETPSFCRR